jgi:hypothetical protein
VGQLELEEDDNAYISSLTRDQTNLSCFSLVKVRYTHCLRPTTESTYFRIQLTNLGKKIFNSPTLREDLKACCERSKVKPKLMIRAVATRWNTMAELIGRAVKLREPLNLLVNLEQHNRGSRGVCLLRFKLSKQEWELLSQLYPLLEVFLEATKKISQRSIPLLHDVVPIFDILTRVLDDYIDDQEKHPAIRATAHRGHAMLNKYYGLTDKSIMYRIAMRE